MTLKELDDYVASMRRAAVQSGVIDTRDLILIELYDRLKTARPSVLCDHDMVATVDASGHGVIFICANCGYRP